MRAKELIILVVATVLFSAGPAIAAAPTAGNSGVDVQNVANDKAHDTVSGTGEREGVHEAGTHDPDNQGDDKAATSPNVGDPTP